MIEEATTKEGPQDPVARLMLNIYNSVEDWKDFLDKLRVMRDNADLRHEPVTLDRVATAATQAELLIDGIKMQEVAPRVRGKKTYALFGNTYSNLTSVKQAIDGNGTEVEPQRPAAHREQEGLLVLRRPITRRGRRDHEQDPGLRRGQGHRDDGRHRPHVQGPGVGLGPHRRRLPRLRHQDGDPLLPDPEELRLFYVMLTSAKKRLDPGGLGELLDWDPEDLGIPVTDDRFPIEYVGNPARDVVPGSDYGASPIRGWRASTSRPRWARPAAAADRSGRTRSNRAPPRATPTRRVTHLAPETSPPPGSPASPTGSPTPGSEPELRDVPVSELEEYLMDSPLNEDRVEELQRQMEEAGGFVGEPLLIEDTRKGPLLTDGRHRLEAAKRAGIDEVPTEWYDSTTTQGRLAATRRLVEAERQKDSGPQGAPPARDGAPSREPGSPAPTAIEIGGATVRDDRKNPSASGTRVLSDAIDDLTPGARLAFNALGRLTNLTVVMTSRSVAESQEWQDADGPDWRGTRGASTTDTRSIDQVAGLFNLFGDKGPHMVVSVDDRNAYHIAQHEASHGTDFALGRRVTGAWAHFSDQPEFEQFYMDVLRAYDGTDFSLAQGYENKSLLAPYFLHMATGEPEHNGRFGRSEFFAEGYSLYMWSNNLLQRGEDRDTVLLELGRRRERSAAEGRRTCRRPTARCWREDIRLLRGPGRPDRPG